VAKTLAKWRPRIRPTAVSRCGWRLGRGYAVQSSGEDDINKEIWGVALLPVDSERRGEPGGEAGRARVLWLVGNSSPEILLRTVRSGRGQSRRPGVQTGKTTCQGGALG
jgi:hypothetical protein